MANRNLSPMILLGGLSVNLNHLKKLQVSYVTMQNNMLDSTQKAQMLYWKMFKSSLKQKSMLHQISETC